MVLGKTLKGPLLLPSTRGIAVPTGEIMVMDLFDQALEDKQRAPLADRVTKAGKGRLRKPEKPDS